MGRKFKDGGAGRGDICAATAFVKAAKAAQIRRGKAISKVIVGICFRLPRFATVWVIKLSCTASAQNAFLLLPPPDSQYKNDFKKFNTYPFKISISILGEQYSASLKIRTMGSFFLLCNDCIVHIFMLLFWGSFKKQHFIQNGGDHSAKMKEQLDFVKLAFIQLLLCHFSTKFFSETLNEIVRNLM